jgi:type I restriction enzyme, S subunit
MITETQIIPIGYKQTDVGVTPEDWDVWQLKDLFRVKGGFAFSSTHFSDKGPILLTPGNFKLDGGLNFDERNTKHYSGAYDPSNIFRNGDLLIVMTDLTPTCNLLGKPAFVQLNEPILHNQRIGKIIPTNSRISLEFLYWYFLSAPHAARMKETATGSTVRHTSNSSIYGGLIALPPTKAEQEAIAEALKDADALIQSIEKLIAKKRSIKQGAMQELLTGKKRLPDFSEKWEMHRLQEFAEIRSGGTPSTTQPQFWNGDLLWCTPTDITTLNGYKYLANTARKITEQGMKSSSAELIPAYSVVMTSRATIGECAINTVPVTTNQGFKNFVPLSDTDTEFLYYLLQTQKQKFISLCGGSTFLEIGKSQLMSFEVKAPKGKPEQTAIASILSDMDAEIAALESKLNKTRMLKQGMLQSLLTGKIRLV